jgi:hypothetical protein
MRLGVEGIAHFVGSYMARAIAHFVGSYMARAIAHFVGSYMGVVTLWEPTQWAML